MFDFFENRDCCDNDSENTTDSEFDYFACINDIDIFVEFDTKYDTKWGNYWTPLTSDR